MIKINLATRKQSGLAADAKGGAKKSLKMDVAQLKDLPLGKLAIAVGAGFAVNFALETYQTGELEKVGVILAKLNADNTKLQAELTKFKEYDSIKKTLEEDELKIKTKLETIQKLISDRPAALNVLLSFSNSIPKDVWLNLLKMDKLELSVKGASIGFNPISDFMKSLHESVSFSSVDLIDTQETKETNEKGVASFELNLKRRESL